MSARILKPGEGQPTGIVGDIYTIKSSARDTGGAYSVMEALVPPLSGPPPHRHTREDESFYVIEGDMEFTADGVTARGGPGTWITLPKGSLHYFKNVGSAPARMLILCVPGGVEEFFVEVSQDPATFSPENPPTVSMEQKKRMLELAPKYGLEIVPPEH